MNFITRRLIGTVIYVLLVVGIGHWLLGIAPTWQELLLVTLATSFTLGVEEGLR